MNILFDTTRKETENEFQYLWRLGQAKDSGLLDFDWNGIADLMNKYFGDPDKPYSEAAWRKPYQQAKKFMEAGVFNKLSEDEYFKELRIQKQELEKQKVKTRDERVALNKTLRETARIEEDLSKLELLIKGNGSTTLPPINNSIESSDNDLFICLSDFHLGMNTDTYFGKYNSDIAAERLSQYLSQILEIQKLHKSENAHVGILGEILNGEIHFTVKL